MNKLVFILLFFVTALASAQNGTIAGTIIDKDYNDEPVAFASIQVKGTSKGAQSDMDGKFTISISPGTYTLIVTFVGMQTVETPVTVVAGNKTDLTIPMTAEAAALDDIVITVQISREKEEVLLKEQQQAVEIKQEIGAQEMSRKGAGDVAAAVSKTTGVSKQEG
ncbi:carboxypeptidase-like regulatory domain-containing protein, partial [Nonlabens mediterrranea]|nr:carboxypeptidase-like regulatory domain-containing protein [Nonlabens mediterrranea]